MPVDDNLRKTEHLYAAGSDLAATDAVQRAAEILRRGGLVALPTETVYGLGADALNETAVEAIFLAKGRPHWDPLIVHISSEAMLHRVVRSVPDRARSLMRQFWPGPLTLLLPRTPYLPSIVTAGRDLVGVRMPAHPIARALIEAAGVPIAAPSANRFGGISPTSAAHVLADLDGRIDAVLDAGPCSIGVESTVLDPNQSPMVVYRPGGIGLAQIAAIAGPVVAFDPGDAPAELRESLPSPGVGIRHYAPRARLLLVDSLAALQGQLQDVNARSTGVLLPSGWQLPGYAGIVHNWETWTDTAALARTLYDGLRRLDATGVETIFCPLPDAASGGLVDALRDRLLKAARES